jgi:hypothetical protein
VSGIFSEVGPYCAAAIWLPFRTDKLFILDKNALFKTLFSSIFAVKELMYNISFPKHKT